MPPASGARFFRSVTLASQRTRFRRRSVSSPTSRLPPPASWPVMRKVIVTGGGRIVNVASIVGFTGYSGLSVYSATKASLLGFTRALAREVGRCGVNVNAVAPGFLDTDMTQGLDGERREQVARRSALRRFPEVDDVADAVEFLLGSKARSITGTVLTVDAGSTA